MARLLLVLVALLAASLACSQPVPGSAPAPTVTPAPSPTAAPRATEDGQTATIRATVWVRLSDNSDSERIGSLTTGDTVEVIGCSGEWCEIRTNVLSGWVWRGCTSDNPNGLLCEARP